MLTKKAQPPVDPVLGLAAQAIETGEYSRARQLLKESMANDMENPETYNLLGISYEKEGNLLKASRCYRVAYYMDQTFQAAADNLERVCQFWRKDSKDIQWGLSIDGR